MNQTLLTVLGVELALYLVMSIVTYLAYARDKKISRQNVTRLKQTQRVPERTLHLMELFFGWPGALLAQRTLHHKNAKRPYQLVFWAIVALHVVLWIVFAIWGVPLFSG